MTYIDDGIQVVDDLEWNVVRGGDDPSVHVIVEALDAAGRLMPDLPAGVRDNDGALVWKLSDDPHTEMWLDEDEHGQLCMGCHGIDEYLRRGADPVRMKAVALALLAAANYAEEHQKMIPHRFEVEHVLLNLGMTYQEVEHLLDQELPTPQWPKYTVTTRTHEIGACVVMEVATNLGHEKRSMTRTIHQDFLTLGRVSLEDVEKWCVRDIAADMADKAERVEEAGE